VKARKRKKLSPKKRLLDIFARRLAKMPANETEKRIAKLKKLVTDDDSSSAHAKHQGHHQNLSTLYAARSH
jgi:hypothetical protein